MILGGAQEDALVTVNALRRTGAYEAGIVAGPETGPEGELLSEARGCGLPVRVVPEMRRAVRPVLDLAAVSALRRLFSELKPDIVQTHSSKAGVLGRLAARAAGVPVVIHRVHGVAFGPWQTRFGNTAFVAAERAAAPLADRLVTVADFLKDQCLAAGVGRPEQFETIRCGFDVRPYLDAGPETRERVRREFGFLEDDLVIVKIARLSELKGHGYVLAAAPEVLRELPRAKFLFVGGGKLRGDLERDAREKLPAGTVRFTGLVPRERIPGVLAASDILVHAGLREGLPLVLVQAMLAGRPVVSFDLDGAPEVVLPGETGLLIEPGDKAGLARAVVGLGRDPGRRAALSARGRAACREAFGLETLVRSIDRLYRGLLREKRLPEPPAVEDFRPHA
jgi:glycosyltransferase involved in cell wall biosynthesis